MFTETVTFQYNTSHCHYVSFPVTCDDLNLDEIFKGFERFLKSAGFDDVFIDRIGGKFGPDTSWVITQDHKRLAE
jgi:hypothetical protein